MTVLLGLGFLAWSPLPNGCQVAAEEVASCLCDLKRCQHQCQQWRGGLLIFAATFAVASLPAG